MIQGDGEFKNPLNVLVIGGSYAGLAAVVNLLDLCDGKKSRFSMSSQPSVSKRKLPLQITIIDERDGYYHLIGSPLALASKVYAEKAWVRFHEIPALQHPSVRVIQGSAESIDCQNMNASILDHQTQNQHEINYDFLIAASGLRRIWPVVPQSLNRDSYLSETFAHIESVRNSKNGVVVIGGGAVGVEMAAELQLVEPNQDITLIHSRDKLLSSEPLPDDFKDCALSTLEESGVKVILGQRVISTEVRGDGNNVLTLSNGDTVIAGHVIKAISKSIPSTKYLPAEILDIDGFVKIGPSLNFLSDMPHSRRHFAVGDIAAWSGIKRCGAAMHMGHYAAINIHQQLLEHYFGETPEFWTISEHPPMIGLAVGTKAVCYNPTEGTTSGKDLMKLMFGVDLGWSICWNYMKLGQSSLVTLDDNVAPFDSRQDELAITQEAKVGA